MFVSATAFSAITAVLLSVAILVDGQSTLLTISQVGGSGGSSTLAGITIGSSVLFSCGVPSIGTYTGTFIATELHAQVSGVDVLICSASATGSCIANSQGAPFQTRNIQVSVPSGVVGTSFTLTSAVVSDSINYYCKIQTTSVLYTQVTNTWTQIQVYSLPITPVCWFTGGTNVFAASTSLPSINCWSNVGAPYGWLQITTSGTIGSYSGAGYPSAFTLSNSTVAQSNGTYSMTYILTYQGGYTLSANNNGDSVTCIAFNSYYNQVLGNQYGVTGTPLYIQVQYQATSIQLSLPAGSGLSLTQSGSSYSLSATQGSTVTVNCAAAGNPTPTYAWTRSSGLNTYTASSQQVTVTLNVVETTVLQCVATNTLTVSSTTGSVTATISITVAATTTTAASTTPGVASAGLSGGAIAGIVIAIIVVVALVIIFAVWCTRCPPGSMKKTSKPQSQQLQPLQASTLQSEPRAPAYEADDRKQPLSVTSEMDIPYGGGAFDDSPRSRKPIVDPHAQSAAEYLDLRGGAYGNGNEAMPPANDGKAYNQYASQPTTPNGNMTAPPSYPGGSTMPRGGQYGTQPNVNAYGTMNGYNPDTMA